MQVFIVLSAALIAGAFAKPSGLLAEVPTFYTAAAIPQLSQYHSQDVLGQYAYGYNGGLSSKIETKTLDGVTRGSYSYVDAAGKLQTVEYTADALNGFRAAATNLPIAPIETRVAPEPVRDTVEVSKAREEHLALVSEANERIKLEAERPLVELKPIVKEELKPFVAELKTIAPITTELKPIAPIPSFASFTPIAAPLTHISPFAPITRIGAPFATPFITLTSEHNPTSFSYSYNAPAFAYNNAYLTGLPLQQHLQIAEPSTIVARNDFTDVLALPLKPLEPVNDSVEIVAARSQPIESEKAY